MAFSEEALVAALQAGDEAAFMELVELYSGPLRRFTLGFVRSPSLADDVVQDTWIALLRGIDRFEGRSSPKTWLFRVASNIAKTRAVREGRSIPFSALGGDGDAEPSVDPDRFLSADDPQWPGHWGTPPESWQALPEERLLAGETRAVIDAAIETLPASQRSVIVLRDIEGFSSDEVAAMLELSEGNQRVLLHRARSKVRAALEDYLVEVAS